MSFRLVSAPVAVTAALLAFGLLVFGAVAAAPAQVDIKRPTDKSAANLAAEQDPALQAHIDYLIKLIDHKNKIIRRSAHQGLAGVGKAALPTLDGLAADTSTGRGKIAARLAANIRKRMDRAAARPNAAGDVKGKNRKKRRRPGVSEKAVAEALQAIGADVSMAGSIKPIVDNHRRRIRELKKRNRDIEPRDAREQRAKAMHEYRDQLNGILGAEKGAAFVKALNRQRGDKRKAKIPSDRSDA